MSRRSGIVGLGLAGFGTALLIAETAYTVGGRVVLHSLVDRRGDAFRFSLARTRNACWEYSGEHERRYAWYVGPGHRDKTVQ